MKKNYLNPYEAPALEIIEVKIEQGFAASTEDNEEGGDNIPWL